MRFWDSSAIVPLILPELTSDALLDVYEDEGNVRVVVVARERFGC
ncbi:MAG: hypothetical protein U0837_12380 [Dehalococcoidia bacterium]